MGCKSLVGQCHYVELYRRHSRGQTRRLGAFLKSDGVLFSFESGETTLVPERGSAL